jgi:hypothetical protein
MKKSIVEEEFLKAKEVINSWWIQKYPPLEEGILIDRWRNKPINIKKYNNPLLSILYNLYKEAFSDFLSFDVEIWSRENGRNLMEEGQEILNFNIVFRLESNSKIWSWSLLEVKFHGNSVTHNTTVDGDYRTQEFKNYDDFEFFVKESITKSVKNLKKWYQNDFDIIYPEYILEKWSITRKVFNPHSIPIGTIQETISKFLDIENIRELVPDGSGDREIEFLSYDSYRRSYLENSVSFNKSGNFYLSLHELYEGGDIEWELENEIKKLVDKYK